MLTDPFKSITIEAERKVTYLGNTWKFNSTIRDCSNKPIAPTATVEKFNHFPIDERSRLEHTENQFIPQKVRESARFIGFGRSKRGRARQTRLVKVKHRDKSQIQLLESAV